MWETPLSLNHPITLSESLCVSHAGLPFTSEEQKQAGSWPNYFIFSPQVPAFLTMSLIQTAGHKMATVKAVFL